MREQANGALSPSIQLVFLSAVVEQEEVHQVVEPRDGSHEEERSERLLVDVLRVVEDVEAECTDSHTEEVSAMEHRENSQH